MFLHEIPLRKTEISKFKIPIVLYRVLTFDGWGIYIPYPAVPMHNAELHLCLISWPFPSRFRMRLNTDLIPGFKCIMIAVIHIFPRHVRRGRSPCSFVSRFYRLRSFSSLLSHEVPCSTVLASVNSVSSLLAMPPSTCLLLSFPAQNCFSPSQARDESLISTGGYFEKRRNERTTAKNVWVAGI